MSELNLSYVQGRIEAIEAAAGDDESAHYMEDKLRNDFIGWIANGADIDPKIRMIARLVLSTEDIDFARWYA